MQEIFHLSSVSEIYRMTGMGKPRHPLVMILPNHCIDIDLAKQSVTTGLYMIAMKDGMSGSVRYGRSHYDFDEGVMLFMAPGQVIGPGNSQAEQDTKGWTLIFHPDLVRRTSLGKKINHYSFFSYDVNEALHLSETEIQTVTELINKVERELEQAIDKHTGNLISANIELLLDYCNRFYDRQFYSRSNQNKDTLVAFERLLRQYFCGEKVIETGLPTVAYCARELAVTPNYLSDLLKKETGKTAKEHIQLFVIEMAKNQLLGSRSSVSKIAFDLGFEYPAHFSRLFKNLTGFSPSQFRKLN